MDSMLMRVGVWTELKSSKTLDSFVKIQNGFAESAFREKLVLLHIHLQCSVLIAGHIPATPVQICASSKTLKAIKKKFRLCELAPVQAAHRGAWPDTAVWDTAPVQLGWNSEQRSQPGCFIFLGIGGTFSSSKSITLSQWRRWKETQVCLLGASKHASVFGEWLGSSALGMNGS